VEAKTGIPPRKVAAAQTCATAAELPREEAGSLNSRLSVLVRYVIPSRMMGFMERYETAIDSD
jgi:hypothetical protein